MKNRGDMNTAINCIEKMQRVIFSFLILSVLLITNSTFTQASSYDQTSHIKRLIINEAQIAKHVYPALALAVAEVESSFNPSAVSPVGAVGVMQIMPRTAKTVFNVEREELFEPKKNITLGIKFLDQLIETYGGNTHYALSHYNGGSKVGQWPNSQIIPYTKNYVEKVLAKTKYYQRRLSQERLLAKVHKPNKSVIKRELTKPSPNIQTSLEEIDFWLAKSSLTSRESKIVLENSLKLKEKIKANRKSFRRWLDGENL